MREDVEAAEPGHSLVDDSQLLVQAGARDDPHADSHQLLVQAGAVLRLLSPGPSHEGNLDASLHGRPQVGRDLAGAVDVDVRAEDDNLRRAVARSWWKAEKKAVSL